MLSFWYCVGFANFKNFFMKMDNSWLMFMIRKEKFISYCSIIKYSLSS